MERSQAEAMSTIRDLHQTALALKDARKAALQPTPLPASKADEAGQLGGASGEGKGEGSSLAEAAAEAGVVGEPEKAAAAAAAGAAKDSD